MIIHGKNDNSVPFEYAEHAIKMIVVLFLLSNSLNAQKSDKDLFIHYGAFKTTFYSGLNEIDRFEFEKELSQSAVAYDLFKDGYIMYRIGGAVYGVSMGIFLVSVDMLTDGFSYAPAIFLGSLGSGIISSIFYYAGKKKIKNSILHFNLDNNSSLNIENSGLDLGFVYRF